jgi:hypothetical protein
LWIGRQPQPHSHNVTDHRYGRMPVHAWPERRSFPPTRPEPTLPPVKLTFLKPSTPTELPDRYPTPCRLAQHLLPMSCLLCICLAPAHATPPVPMRDSHIRSLHSAMGKYRS